MTPLDRSFIAWSKGNKRGSVGAYRFTATHVFCDGVAVCVRVRDLADKALILVQIGGLLNPERVFRDRRWVYASRIDFDGVPALFEKIAYWRAQAKHSWRNITISDLATVGQALTSLKSYSVRENHQLAVQFKDTADELLTVTDLEFSDPVVLGAKFLLRGRAGAICVAPNEYSSWERKHILFEHFSDAMLFKLQKEGVDLHDLEIT